MKNEDIKVDTSDVEEHLYENFNHDAVERKNHAVFNTFLVIIILMVGGALWYLSANNIDVIGILGLKKQESAIDNRVYEEDKQFTTTTTEPTTSTTTTTTSGTTTTTTAISSTTTTTTIPLTFN